MTGKRKQMKPNARHPQSLLLAWEKYRSFENLHRQPDDDLIAFTADWQKSRKSAEAVGCQYSDLVLACKLVEKANLPEDVIESILTDVQSTVFDGGSVLDEILTRFKAYEADSLRNGSVSMTNGTEENNDTKVFLNLNDMSSSHNGEINCTEENIDTKMFLNDVPFDTEEDDEIHNEDNVIGNEDDIVTRTESAVKSCAEDSTSVEIKPPSKLCPHCSNALTNDGRNVSPTTKLGIYVCDACKIQLFARLVERKGQSVWDYLLLPKCPKCSQFLDLANPSTTSKRKDIGLVCKGCDVDVNSVLFGPKLILLREAVAKKSWAKAWRHKAATEEGAAAAKPKRVNKATMGDYQCEICGKSFTRLSSIITHRKTHILEKVHKCEFCKKMFRTLNDLKIHTNVHTAEKVLVCSFCGKKFTRYSNYYEHLNIHTKARSYNCKKCDAKFVHRASLVLHIRVHHTFEKPYKCDECDRSFFTASKLTDHKRIHSGAKPYKCKFCDKDFRLRTTMNRHIKLHCKGKNAEPAGAVDIKPPLAVVNEPPCVQEKPLVAVDSPIDDQL